ncbi:hypothetical protein [Dyadobacter bucti]|uniref:hypothetical protein n=1 Tax=Dyadobacter bucti TaxID=2572203 RepID=UPI00140AE99A|nr:hypothetical protein [Dyadobacter bucti]
MEDIKKALSYFVNKDMLDKEEFTNEVWQNEIGPAIVLLEKKDWQKAIIPTRRIIR